MTPVGDRSALTGRPPRAAIEAVMAELTALFGERLVTSAAVRAQHANTLTLLAPEPPDAVVFPEATAQVVAIVETCARHGVPIIPYGTGTSFEGHVNAPGAAFRWTCRG